MTTHKLLRRLPTATEYEDIYTAAGTPVSIERTAVNTALDGSLYGVTVVDGDGTAVGMGRVVGDGGIYYAVVDVIISPRVEDTGLEVTIMKYLTDYLDAHAAKDAFIAIAPSSTDFAELECVVRA